MTRRTKPSGSRQLLGLVVGYLGADLLVSYTGFPRGLIVSLGIVIPFSLITAVVVVKFPRGSYGRKLYRYRVGQFGAWLASILLGGFLPLLKSFIYSEDILTYVILVPPLVAGLYLLLIAQDGFHMPRPVKKLGVEP